MKLVVKKRKGKRSICQKVLGGVFPFQYLTTSIRSVTFLYTERAYFHNYTYSTSYEIIKQQQQQKWSINFFNGLEDKYTQVFKDLKRPRV